MEQWLWIVIIAGAAVSLTGSALILFFVLKRARKREQAHGISRPKANASQSAACGRRWNRIISIYLLLCLIFMGVILYQSTRGPGREAFDCLAIPVGALFFLIQAFSYRNTAVRRERATAFATATFLKCELADRSQSGHRSYRSTFEFYADGRTYRVCHAGRPGGQEGAQVELCYAPDDPAVIYIPEMERRKGRFFPALLLAYGILFPLVALLAPLFR